MKDIFHDGYVKLHDLLEHLFGGDKSDDDAEREEPAHELGKHIDRLRKRGVIYFERIDFGRDDHDGHDYTLLATVVGGVIIPDFDFEFCEDFELISRYGVENSVIATYVKRRVRKVGYFIVDTRTGEIGRARPPLEKWLVP